MSGHSAKCKIIKVQNHSFLCLNLRSSRPEVFCKNCVLKNFAKFTGKYLCGNLFLNKVAGLNFIKKGTPKQAFS